MVESFLRNHPLSPNRKRLPKKEGSFFLECRFLRHPRQCQLHAHAEYDPAILFLAMLKVPGIRKINPAVDSDASQIESINAETEVKSSVRPSQGYNDGVPQEGQENLVRG